MKNDHEEYVLREPERTARDHECLEIRLGLHVIHVLMAVTTKIHTREEEAAAVQWDLGCNQVVAASQPQQHRTVAQALHATTIISQPSLPFKLISPRPGM